jgi:anti-anti-sigma regulatory factor
MNYSVKQLDDARTLVVKGSLNMRNVERLKDVLLTSLNNADNVVFDIERLEDISFACLQILCSACRTASLLEKRFMLVSRHLESFRTIIRKSGFATDKECPFNGNCALVAVKEGARESQTGHGA